ncbi:MAG: DUF3836 domain-containing protein [Bacteroides sp.]|nr:DUF3836 domain-containing protein [Bacteroides sp.]
MKTTVFFKALVVMAVVMVSGINFTASAANPTEYVKNEVMDGNRVAQRTIYKNNEGYLTRHLLYTFTYDDENRVTIKQASKWDSINEAWVPYFKMEVNYSADSVTVDYALWDARSKTYNLNEETMVYDLTDGSASRLLASAN